jgi:hypothetical protein
VPKSAKPENEMSVISAGPAQGFVISQIIIINVNGTNVEGHLFGCSYDINVEITQPFKNLVTGSHIMYLARGHCSFDGEYGELRARQMLTYLFRVGDYVSRKHEMLKVKLAEHRQQVTKVSEGRFTESEFKRRRLVLRRMLRRGDITNIQYQRWIGMMRKDVESLERRIWQLEDQFWDAYFPMLIGSRTDDTVLDILDGKRRLT